MSPNEGSTLRLAGHGIQAAYFLFGLAKLIEPVDLSAYLTKYASDDPRVAPEMIKNPISKISQTGLDLLGTFSFLRCQMEFAAGAPNCIPVLMIQGAEDQIVEPSSAKTVFEALRTKAKKLVYLPGCGHVLVGTAFIKAQTLDSIEDWLAANGGPFR